MAERTHAWASGGTRAISRNKPFRDALSLPECSAGAPGILARPFQLAVVHGNLGLEREAIPFYTQALALGLSGLDLERAYLGLGSTYRILGAYQLVEETLRQGVQAFPQNRAIQIFLAMTLYNRQQHREAMELVLSNLMETTSDEKLASNGKSCRPGSPTPSPPGNVEGRMER